jgi:hypothetical protein
MSTLPTSGATELTSGQAVPETTVNDMGRRLDAGWSRAIIEDRDLTAPPGTCGDGANYLVKATATGAWAGHDGQLATALGTNASNGWDFITVAKEGIRLYVKDEDAELVYNGSAWVAAGGGISALTGDVTASGSGSVAATVANANYSATLTASGTPVTNSLGYLGAPQNQQDANYTLVMSDSGKHLYHTSGTGHTWTIPANSSVAFPIGTILTFVNENGAANVTIAITTDTLRWGASTGSRTLAQNGTCSAVKVTSTSWRLTGDGIT